MYKGYKRDKIEMRVDRLAEIENGKKGMSAETLYRLCDAFYLSAEYLLFGRITCLPVLIR